jgi:hypothetical protein
MTYYNYQIHKKLIVIFGKMFSNIYIKKMVNEDITSTTRDEKMLLTLQEIKVPISYAKKDKLIARYLRREVSLKGVAMTLPRMAFEITNVYYDPERKLNKINKFISTANNNAIVNSQYTPVPYNFDIELSIIVSKMDDGVRIVEDILPEFTPDIKISTNLIPDNDILVDIPVILNDVYMQDNYEGEMNRERVIIWGLRFTMKAWLFGELNTDKLITSVITRIGFDYNIDGTLAETISNTVTPDPSTAFYNQDYGFLES